MTMDSASEESGEFLLGTLSISKPDNKAPLDVFGDP